jgi:hypothetical protein
MSICSNCYTTKFRPKKKYEVGHWWNNESYLAVVCSDRCKDELEKRVQDRTWMEWRRFPKSEQELPEEVRAVTDKQFTANL